MYCSIYRRQFSMLILCLMITRHVYGLPIRNTDRIGEKEIFHDGDGRSNADDSTVTATTTDRTENLILKLTSDLVEKIDAKLQDKHELSSSEIKLLKFFVRQKVQKKKFKKKGEQADMFSKSKSLTRENHKTDYIKNTEWRAKLDKNKNEKKTEQSAPVQNNKEKIIKILRSLVSILSDKQPEMLLTGTAGIDLNNEGTSDTAISEKRFDKNFKDKRINNDILNDEVIERNRTPSETYNNGQNDNVSKTNSHVLKALSALIKSSHQHQTNNVEKQQSVSNEPQKNARRYHSTKEEDGSTNELLKYFKKLKGSNSNDIVKNKSNNNNNNNSFNQLINSEIKEILRHRGETSHTEEETKQQTNKVKINKTKRHYLVASDEEFARRLWDALGVKSSSSGDQSHIMDKVKMHNNHLGNEHVEIEKRLSHCRESSEVQCSELCFESNCRNICFPVTHRDCTN